MLPLAAAGGSGGNEMILTVDIGNSNIVMGCVEGEQILFEARLRTDATKTSDEYCIDLKMLLEVYDVDPQQVNVPGDWSEAKEKIGLEKPTRRNEGTPEQNIRAAIKFLVRKGFGSSGQPAARRPKGVFDDWQTALRRYNGRVDEMVDGRNYSETYADHIVSRAKDPSRFVAIRKRLKE
jgi:hypothetical protein